MTPNKESATTLGRRKRRAARILRRGMNSTDNVFYAFSDRNVRDKYANMR
jgi:hypothetical protein